MQFKKYYKKFARENFGSIYNLIVIMKFLEKYNGYDFSKPCNVNVEPKKRYFMKDESGNEYYL